MKRKSPRMVTNSTRNAKITRDFDAERSIRELTERVHRLEQRITEYLGPGTEELSAMFVEEERRKPGPKPIHLQMLLHERDQLVEMLENYWPELEPLGIPKPNPQVFRRVLECIAAKEQEERPVTGRHVWATLHLVSHHSEVMQFVSGDRFRRDPRQIANAFAGVPIVGVWRSLRVCQGTPCTAPIGQRAIRAYIRRKHPELFARLVSDSGIVNFATALKSYRSKDRALLAFSAKHLLYCWPKCVSDMKLTFSSRHKSDLG